jgi:hypothetical protein
MTPIRRPAWWDRLDPVVRQRLVHVGLVVLILLIVIAVFAFGFAGGRCHGCI